MATERKMESKPISTSTVRKATINVVRNAKANPTALRSTPGLSRSVKHRKAG